MHPFGGSVPINGQVCWRRDRYITPRDGSPLQHQKAKQNSASMLLLLLLQRRHFLMSVILFQLLLVCSSSISTVTSFQYRPHDYHTLSHHQQQQQQRSYAILMFVSRRGHQNLQSGNIHHSPSAAILTRRQQRIGATTRINASIESPHNNSLSQKQQLLGRTRQEDKIYRRITTKTRELKTLFRVGLPSILAGVLAYLVFPYLAMTLASSVTSAGALTVLSTDSSQFVQNFLSVSSLLFSILVGQTCKLAATFLCLHCKFARIAPL